MVRRALARSSAALLACLTIASVRGSFQDVPSKNSNNPILPPMITSPQPGAEICPDTIVTSCGIDQPGLPRTFALDQEFLDIPEDQINEFPLFALSEGQHSLEVIVFQPDPSFTSKESVVLFQHWVIFNVNQSACDRADESQKIDEDSAHDRHRFARIQMQLFLASITQLPRDQIEVPPGMLTDIIGVIHPIYVSLLPKDAREEARTTTILGFNVNAGPSEDLFEVSSVVAALWRTASRERREDFLFVDLGAAWGRQAPRVALLGQRMGVHVRTLALEAEPTHFEMSDEVYRLNGLVPNGQEHRLVFGAVGWKDGHADFLVGDAYKWWGQALSFNALNPNVESVPMFTLKTLLAHEPLADLIHFDVQGAVRR